MMASATPFALSLTTSHGMVDGIHDHAADVRAASKPACAPGLAAGNVHVVGISDLADRGVAFLVDPANFSRGELDQGITAFAVRQGGVSTGATDHLGPPAGNDLNIMDCGAERDRLERKGITHGGLGPFSGVHPCPDRESDGSEDVGLFTIGILEQGDASRAVRIIFDGEDFGGDSLFLALEIYQPVFSLMSAAAVPHGEPAVVVAAARPLPYRSKRLFRLVLGNLGEVRKRLEAIRGSERSEILESHDA